MVLTIRALVLLSSKEDMLPVLSTSIFTDVHAGTQMSNLFFILVLLQYNQNRFDYIIERPIVSHTSENCCANFLDSAEIGLRLKLMEKGNFD
jgi:hypothetical protein